MNINLPITGHFIGRDIMFIFLKVSAKPLIVVLGACICLALTLLTVHKAEAIAQKGSFAWISGFCGPPQTMSKQDKKFLDDLVQQQNQDNERETASVATSGQNLAKLESDSKPVPRAELIVNTSPVKRARLVAKQH